MNSSDELNMYSDNSSYNYEWSWGNGENSTLSSTEVREILNSPLLQLAFTITKVLSIACFCMTFILGILGNGLVIWIAGFKMKTVSAVWFVNLAIVDFMFCISLPVRVAKWLLTTYTIDHLITFNFYMLYTNSIISVLFLTVISIDRCVTIMWPLWAKIHRTQKLAKMCAVFIWIVPSFITITSIYYIGTDIHQFYAVVPIYENLYYYCWMEYSFLNSYLMFIRSFFMFWLCFAIILVCYGLIIFRLCSNSMTRTRKFQRTFRIIIAVMICFFCCWFPYNMWPYVAKSQTIQVLTDFIISSVCLCLVTISSCLNPILYVLLGKGGGSSWRKFIKSRLESAMNDLK